MSIFKNTLNPIIAAQLKARETVVSQWGNSREKDPKGNPIYKAGITPRDNKFLRYVAGKNAWIKLSSFVNYDSKVFKNGEWIDDGRYKGNQLAKKYVLEGGTLFNNKDLRSGVGINKTGTVYGSELDKISADPKKNTVDRLYGIRPMPGIESANIINISAYGSLREATVRFYAWDRHQLEELEILYMRPGYTCLLEWGWSQYLKHPLGRNINETPDYNDITIENFSTGINAFEEGLTEQNIYDRIDTLVGKYYGNYDAMLGYVKNFSWQLMSNGGYECSTTLISRGEVLETIKASANPNIIIGSNTNEQITTLINEAEQKPSISYFEKIFLNLIGYINDSEITAKQGQFNTTIFNPDGTPIIKTDPTQDQAQQQKIRETIKSVGDDIIKRVKSMKLKRYNPDEVGDIEPINEFDIQFNNNGGFYIRPIDGGTNGSAIEYITLDSFIAILNTFFIFKNENKNNIIDIILPYKTPFLISEDTVSIDPTTCLIRNNKAKFITDDDINGFDPEVYSVWSNKVRNKKPLQLPDIINKNNSFTGVLGNICISVQKIIDVYRQLYNTGDGVSIIDLLTSIMENVNLALGGINNFTIYTNRNIVQIIDAHYLESKTDKNGDKDNKFIFDLIGLKSICRDVKINSRIFSEQSTMISIGAASSGYNNVGDIYSSTQTAFNRGLKDRIIGDIQYDTTNTDKSITIYDKTYPGSVSYYYKIAINILSLSNYIKRKVLGTNIWQNKPISFKITRVPQEEEIINANSLLKSVHYQINGDNIDFKALIPFELEITLDGISGFVTGQIFRINKNILPKDYHNKNIGFIITKQSHALKGNDWITNIITQVCLLNNNDYPYPGIPKNDLKKIITTITSALKTVSYLKYAMADYMVYLTYHLLSINKKSPIKINVTYNEITKVFNGIGSNILDFDAYLRNWIRSFQVKEDIGFKSPYYNPSYRKGLSKFSETELLPNFPKTSGDIGVVVNPSTNEKVLFDSKFFEIFIFDKVKAAKDKKALEDAKNEITENERKRYVSDSFAVSESTRAITATGETLPESVKIDLELRKIETDKANSFLSTPKVDFTVNNSPFSLPAIIPLNGTLEDFFKSFIVTKSADPESQQIDSTGNITDQVLIGEAKYIDVKGLYTSYLKYIDNTYFTETKQEIFKGGGTTPISIFWGFDNIENEKYYGSQWYEKQFESKVKSGLK